jgi:hypothetical protein
VSARTAGAAARSTALLVVALVTWPAPARAWQTVEHQEIGTAAYLGACAEVEAVVDAAPSDEAVRARLEIACGASRAILASLYGDATAIAGDFVGHPSELLSPAGAWRFSSPTHYYLLALENSAHFNPMATQSWREYHLTALDHAAQAAAAAGLAQVDEWEQAARESAFADHLLHDSFASGHMGFNRRASSAAAAKRFHDFWNSHGRAVHDRAGGGWKTYGDGRLDDSADATGRRHVVDAATASIRDVMQTFVLGRRQPELSLAVWMALPFTIEAPELLVDAEGLVAGREMARETPETPLAATVVPARKNTVGNATVWAAAPFSEEPTVAATASVELAIPVLPAQTKLGAGGTLRQPDGRHSLVLEGGLLAPLALSVDGLVSHEVAATATLIFLHDLTTMIHVEYTGNVELGESLISVHGGLAEFLPARRLGWFAALGYGFTFTAAGGGSL